MAMARAELCHAGTGRQVLLTEVDLFRNLGGGQTVLRRLIASRPQDEILLFPAARGPPRRGRRTPWVSRLC